MIRERRFAARKSVCLDVIVSHGFDDAGLWKTRNLSLDGALIDMPPESLPLQAEVEAILALAERDHLEHYHLVARVVRVGPDGVALALHDYGIRIYTALVKLLHAE
ncbi:MAG: PilZ domain-containing protein [Gammaproteobacteria bacterium]|nr:PilZ domain-containing protein [Gammaproteobacteria bacterium]